MDRLEVQTEEKRLNVTLRCEDDWMLPADRKLLEQAFFAILSNAVSYNREEGRVRIVLKKGICTIENTGDNIRKSEQGRPGEASGHGTLSGASDLCPAWRGTEGGKYRRGGKSDGGEKKE